MALTNTRALCLLADVEDDLGITDSSTAAALERRILVASALVESYLGRKLRREVGKVESLAGFGTSRLLPALTPIEVVSEVTYLGELVSADSYELESDNGEAWALYSPTGWVWTAPGVQGVDSALRPLPGQERKSFRVTYTGGYWLPNDSGTPAGAQLPAPIREAAVAMAVHLWRRRGADSLVVSETAGNASATRRAVVADDVRNGIPPEIAALLDDYRRAV